MSTSPTILRLNRRLNRNGWTVPLPTINTATGLYSATATKSGKPSQTATASTPEQVLHTLRTMIRKVDG